MQIFLFTIFYFLIVACSIFLIIKISDLLPKIKLETQKANSIEKKFYKDLRELQFKAKELNKLAEKLNKQKASLVGELSRGLLITLLPFRKLKSAMLIYSFFKKALSK